MGFDFTMLAADQPRYNCSLAQAHQFIQVCNVIGLSNPRIFVEPKPNFQNGVFLIPGTAKKGDDQRWPDRQDVDTTGNDMQALFTGEDPGDNPMFLQLSCDETDDFHTIAPWYTALTDPKRKSQRVLILTAFLHEVGMGGKRPMGGLIGNLPGVLPQVESALGV